MHGYIPQILKLARRFQAYQHNHSTLITDDIIKPQQPLALRTSGTLLLGCARIYEFKLAMLFQDCANAMKRLQTVSIESFSQRYKSRASLASMVAAFRWKSLFNLPLCTELEGNRCRGLTRACPDWNREAIESQSTNIRIWVE